jgi:two-component system response regulator MprA
MRNEPAARILVVDDDAEVRASMRRGLATAGFAVLLAEDGASALRQVRDDPPDLVVLDIMMPGLDGLDVVRRLRAGDEVLPVIMVTARDTVPDRVAGLDAGADDYLIKPFALSELIARIRVRLRHREAAGTAPLRFADLRLDTGAHEAFRGDRVITLTNTEYELLRLFLLNPRQVLSRGRIYERVWGYDFIGESKVIEVYVRYLREKLEAGGEPRLIHTLRGAGYVLKEGG